MAKGYDGSILHVDLSTSTSRERLGGRAATEYALHVEGVAGVPREATFSAEHDLERLRCAEPLRLLKPPPRVPSLEMISRLIAALTGRHTSSYELMRMSERRNQLMRVYTCAKDCGIPMTRSPPGS